MLLQGNAGQESRAGLFLEDVKRFVPDYDSMAQKMIALLQTEWPKRILDIGSGAGNIDMMILDNVPASRIDCVEMSKDMVKASISTLGRHLDRAEIIHKDVADFNPEGKYDAIISNLVFHNMSIGEKARLLGRIRGWLAPHGIFIWGDMIRLGQKEKEKNAQKKTCAQRLGSAIRRGKDKKPSETISKGAENDYPLTEEETSKLADEAGFSEFFLEWKRGGFAIFSMRK